MYKLPDVVHALRFGLSALPLTTIGVVLASTLTTGGVGAAATFTPIAVSFVTPVPGAPGVTFGIYPTPPAFDGQRVVFASQLPSTSFRALWSAGPDGAGLISLADDN